ncbi:MAG: hypothetical protein AAGA15_01070 [Pseudomonadota bacterium]
MGAVASVDAPEIEAEPAFVIPQYANAPATPKAPALIVAPEPAVATVSPDFMASEPEAFDLNGSDADAIVATIPHLPEHLFDIDRNDLGSSGADLRVTNQVPGAINGSHNAAPILVSHVPTLSTSGGVGTVQAPGYVHGVYR